jgi:hypothetical protein
VSDSVVDNSSLGGIIVLVLHVRSFHRTANSLQHLTEAHSSSQQLQLLDCLRQIALGCADELFDRHEEDQEKMLMIKHN